MDLRLTRIEDDGNCTIGKLALPDDKVFFTVERPWIGNLVGRSCVPAGQYDLVPHASARFGRTWALVNRQLRVVHQPADIPADAEGVWRSAILIHVGNWSKDLRGCIAPGLGYKRRSEHGQMVTQSTVAMRHLRSLLGPMTRGHRIIIEGIQK